MAKFCPVVGHRVVYLTCQECDNRVCERSTTASKPAENAQNNNDKNDEKDKSNSSASTESPTNACTTDCRQCCHNLSIQEDQFGTRKYTVSRCAIYRNYLLDYEKIKTHGCEHFNKDYSQRRICMNCSYYLGGGDWGLACSKHYHRLPQPFTEACGTFNPKSTQST